MKSSQARACCSMRRLADDEPVSSSNSGNIISGCLVEEEATRRFELAGTHHASHNQVYDGIIKRNRWKRGTQQDDDIIGGGSFRVLFARWRWPPLCSSGSPLLIILSLLILIILPGQLDAQSTVASVDDVILSTAFNRAQQTTESEQRDREEQMMGNRFKYHLNHLRPPSLVPITIQQVAGDSVSIGAGSGSGGQQQQPNWSLHTQRKPLLDGTTSGLPMNSVSASSSTLHVHSNLSTAAKTTTTTTSDSVTVHERPQYDRLVQLQLPLQLHLKLKPLPLPMPPPTGQRQRSPAADQSAASMAAAEKRKRSLEQQHPASSTNTTTTPVTPTTTNTPMITTTVSSANQTTSVRPRDKETTIERRDLLTLTKRILLLSSMSPAIVQAKLDRRFAMDSLDNYNNDDDSKSVGEELSVKRSGLEVMAADVEQQQTPTATITTTTTTTPTAMAKVADTTTSASPATSKSNLLRWKPNATAQQQQPPTGAPSPANKQSAAGQTAQKTSLSPVPLVLVSATGVAPRNESASSASTSTSQREVRRQRHSSQQLQGQHHLTVPPEVADSRIQAMAAAMLPLFWPSFQLAGSHRLPRHSSLQQTTTPLPGGLNLVSSAGSSQTGWSGMKYTQLSRTISPMVANYTNTNSGSPMAASNFAPTIVSPDSELPIQEQEAHLSKTATAIPTQPSTTTTTTTTTTSTTTTTIRPQSARSKSPTRNEKPVRKKRRKPTYLQQPLASTPYPDSTRMASKYPMPKIKFQPKETTLEPHVVFSAHSPLEESNNRPKQQLATSPKVHQQEKKLLLLSGEQTPVQVPKSLSALIEQQLLMNVTNLLLHHKNQTYGRMVPTTSVSRVVRLRNDTDSHVVMSSSFSSKQSRDTFPQDLKRNPTTMSPALKLSALITTVFPPPPPTTTTTTTSNPISSRPRFVPTPTPPPLTTTTSPAEAATTTTAATTFVPSTTSAPPQPVLATTTKASQPTTSSPPSSLERKRAMSSHLTNNNQRSTTTLEPTDRLLYPSLHTQQSTSQTDNNNNGDKDIMIGTNKVLPEEEPAEQSVVGQASSSSSSTTEPTSPEVAPPRGYSPRKYGQNSHSSGTSGGKNIKLFHFKRKPDMNKLPFYKKPLNYTELGWTTEQIQEHLESIGIANSDSLAPNLLASSSGSGSSISSSSEVDRAELLLKRKRRGKNQFERLMAELHGTSGPANPIQVSQLDQFATDQSASERPIGPQPDRHRHRQQAAAAAAAADSEAAATRDEEDLVPVIKKKVEPLVMKPMFFVMNQKRRVNNNSASLSSTAEATTPTLPALDSSGAFGGGENKMVAHNKSKPIIRMRRKHNGDHPVQFRSSSSQLELMGQQQPPWRPSKAFWAASSHKMSSLPAQMGGERLLLVPSGLLTPSGSQLVPLYAPSASAHLSERTQTGEISVDEQSKLANDFFAWRPSRHHLAAASSGSGFGSPPVSQLNHHHSNHWQESKPSGGLAPSGEESFLLAPSTPVDSNSGEGGRNMMLVASSSQLQSLLSTAAAQEKQRKQQQQVAPSMEQVASPAQGSGQSAPAGELRVPKLLVKPMRPAKYSLNGYIPKPTLGQQQQQQQPQALTPQAVQRSQARLRSASANSPLLLANHGFSSKDLDSSTSNEIFSRRRGLQQHQRTNYNQQAGGLSSNSLLTGGLPANNQTAAVDKQSTKQSALQVVAMHRQMEEKKRKYILQQQDTLNRSPTLSIQKANLIKAKLGLIVTRPSSSSYKQQPSTAPIGGSGDSSQHQSAAALASTNSILTSDPDQKLSTDQLASQSGQLIGAPLNTIPKTDFECTDKKGKFIAGLFADHKTGCQVWHLCSNNRKYSFLCPTGTIFNAKLRICDWRYNVKCENSLPF